MGTSSPELLLELDRNHPRGLRVRIEDGIRRAIRGGRRRPGARMPSTRALATDLGVTSRVVVEAYDQLVAEDFLRSRQGAGTVVAAVPRPGAPARSTAPADVPVQVDFAPGRPDPALFPVGARGRAHEVALQTLTAAEFTDTDLRGLLRLRRALADYLGRVRGVAVEPDRIVVCAGFGHAFDLVARALPGQRFAVEDPGYAAPRERLAAAGRRFDAVPVDAEGLVVDELRRSAARVVTLTPAHQSPTGVTMTPQRRHEPVAARAVGGFVVEDDVDAEFRCDRRPVGALHGLVPERVIYAGTTAKTPASGVRIGRVVPPEPLVEEVCRRRALGGSPPSTLLQATFAEVVASGDLDRHLRRPAGSTGRAATPSSSTWRGCCPRRHRAGPRPGRTSCSRCPPAPTRRRSSPAPAGCGSTRWRGSACGPASPVWCSATAPFRRGGPRWGCGCSRTRCASSAGRASGHVVRDRLPVRDAASAACRAARARQAVRCADPRRRCGTRWPARVHAGRWQTPRRATVEVHVNGHGDTVVVLSADGVGVVLHTDGGRLPAVRHWGAALPEMTAADASALVAAGVPVPASSTPDVPVRVSVLPEPSSGWSGRPGLSGSRAGRGWSTAFRVESVHLDGAPVDGFVSASAATVGYEAVDPDAELRLRLEIELLPAGLLRARATVTNEGADPYTVDELCLALPVPTAADELLDFAGRHNQERVPQRTAFRTGLHLRENRRGRTGPDSAYVLHAGAAGFGFARGEVHAVHTAWSGNHVHYAERAASGPTLLGGGELLLPGEIRLGTGESYRSPWLYGAHGEGLDAVAGRFHRFQRSRARPVDTKRPVTLNVWEAVYFDHDAARLIDLAERAAALGVERFVLDDGWFGGRRDDRAGLGDWVVSPDVWPDGLHPLVDRVRALGMEFGLWFEPEMVNLDSDVARAHPEWIMAARSDLPVPARHQQVLNLGVPEAYAHVRDQMLALLDEYEIDYIKWDHNRDLVEAGTRPDGGRPGVHAQTAAFYRLLDELRAAHPGLEIESCSSGGARVDLEVLARTDRIWVSDDIDPHDRQRMLRWTAQLVPPEYLGSHIASGRSHTTGRVHDLGFRAATAVFGHLGIEWDLAAASAAESAELAAWIAWYREHRELLLGGTLVRMDGYPGAFVHGVVAPDRSRAVYAFAPADSLYPDPVPALRLRGLDPGRRYRVRPVLVAASPSGLRPPPWWGEPDTGAPPPPADHPFHHGVAAAARFPGSVFTGAALEHVGVTAPIVHPDQAVLLQVDAE